jgi:hypothetical protein
MLTPLPTSWPTGTRANRGTTYVLCTPCRASSFHEHCLVVRDPYFPRGGALEKISAFQRNLTRNAHSWTLVELNLMHNEVSGWMMATKAASSLST